MAAPQVTLYGVPSGGVVSLSILGVITGPATLERAASGQPFTTIYSGVAVPQFLDIGDGLPGPLNASTPYQYRYTDVSGVTTTPFIIPASLLAPVSDPVTQVLERVIQGALNAVAPLPNGVKRAKVTQAMPLGGQIALPLVVINQDLIQQDNVPIGQSIPALAAVLAAASGVPASGYAQVGFAKRVYRVSVLSTNGVERDFYRDFLILVFEAIYQYVLQPLGLDVEHKWQVASGQVANDRTGMAPGFFFAEFIFDFTGTFNAVIYPNYGLINTITVTTSGQQAGPQPTGLPPSSDPVTDVAQAPHN